MKTDNKIKNVFVLCTGRCGSVTFYEACKEIKNFTCDHESKVRELGEQRIDYPDYHIEVDNRLSWFLGRLNTKYGSAPLYVHLFRDETLVSQSYNKRWFRRGSIVRAYARGILARQDLNAEISQDMVRCQLENIEHFLSNKDKVIRINIASPIEGFKDLWNQLNADGDLDTALEKLKISKNTSVQSYEKKTPFEGSFDEQQLSEEEQIDSLEERITNLQHENKSLNKVILESHAKNRKLDTTITSLKSVNTQQKTRIERLINAKSYRSIAVLKRNIRSPKKWPSLLAELFDILYRENRNTSKKALGRKDIILVASKIKNIKEAETFILKSGTSSDLTALSLLKANQCLESNSEWLEHTNAYIRSFDLKPISLKTGQEPLFERLDCTDFDKVDYGPLISIIMPAFNSEKTLKLAADSILNQSWGNLELIIVNDCSTDQTREISEKLAERDSRVILLNNSVNVGPYVSKNRGLDIARGEYITGHDADDWAMPQRIEMQYLAIVNNKVKACACAMLRVEETGNFVRFGRINNSSYDGALRLASISTMFCASFFRQHIGYWDSVRYAADSEVISRAMIKLGESGVLKLWIPGMLCLESSSSLTNNPTTGVDPTAGLSPIRITYRESWERWHKSLSTDSECRLSFPIAKRPFDVPLEMRVSQVDIHTLFKATTVDIDTNLPEKFSLTS